jgi:hypothetical protein
MSNSAFRIHPVPAKSCGLKSKKGLALNSPCGMLGSLIVPYRSIKCGFGNRMALLRPVRP